MSDAVVETAEIPAPPQEAPGADTSEADAIAAALAAVDAEGEPAAPAEDKPAKEAAPKEEPAKEAKDDEAPAEGEEPKGPAAKGWAAVRRVEQKLVKRQKEFDARAQQVEAAAKTVEQRLADIAKREAELDADPVAFLTKRGVHFDDLAKRYLNNGQASPEELARRTAVKSDETAKQYEDRMARIEAMLQSQVADKHVATYKAEIKSTLAVDDFELLRAYPDAEAEVYEFADKWVQRHGEVLTPRAAAEKLQAQLRKDLTHLSSNQAVRSLLAGAGNGATSKQAVSGQSQAPRGSGASPKTLTNNLAATPAAGEPDFDSLSEEDQIQAALRLVQGVNA